MKNVYLVSILLLLLLFVNMTFANELVIIEFLYHDPKSEDWDPFCEPCILEYEAFIRKNETMKKIQSDYEGEVQVNWIEFNSQEAQNLKVLFKITQPNSIVIRSRENSTIIEGNFNETHIREVIDAYLIGTSPPPNPTSDLVAILALSFSLGLLETISPCLLILLSFILSLTIGETKQFKDGVFTVISFGLGFVSAATILLIGLTEGLIALSSMRNFANTLMYSACIFAIIFGLHLLGFNLFGKFKAKIEIKPLISELTKKYALTYMGLVFLGFFFYFLDPCMAPIFSLMLAAIPCTLPQEYLLLIFLVFSLSVFIPFIGIGIFAGSISKLVRTIYRHKSKIRAISGLILVAYSVYIIVLYVF